MKPEITIFTPTYNRGYIIEKLYHSLRNQSFKNFEWLVIDDGSTDNTESLFLKWIEEENDFHIVYKKVENGGKHRAINLGIETAKGKLFFIVDSDDYITDDALKKISEWEKTIINDFGFAGVSGLRGYSQTKIIGTTFRGEFVDSTSLEREKCNIYGDKAEVFYTDILKKYKFPEYEGENFVSENVVWYAIANDGYKIRWFNEIIYICNYLDDGLTNNIEKVIAKSPKGWIHLVRQTIRYKQISRIHKLKSIAGFTKEAHVFGLSAKKAAESIEVNLLLFLILKLMHNIKNLIKKRRVAQRENR